MDLIHDDPKKVHRKPHSGPKADKKQLAKRKKRGEGEDESLRNNNPKVLILIYGNTST